MRTDPKRCPRSVSRSRWPWWAVGLASLLWVALRSGTNPRRLAYPCQQAALASGSAALGSLLTAAGMGGLYRLLRQRTTLGRAGAAVLALAMVLSLGGSSTRSDAGRLRSSLTLAAWTSPTAISNVYAVADVPVPACSLAGGTLPAAPPCNDPAYALHDAGVDALLAEMDAHGDRFYETAAHPEGIVGSDDVVVIKVNNQWGLNGDPDVQGRLSTNTDVLKGVIWRILQHPDGFSGEVVVAENTQESGAQFDTTPANSEDRNQSLADVVDAFAGLGYPVSAADWNPLNWNLISGGPVIATGIPLGEYAHGNMDDAYIMLEDPDGVGTDELAYPKFQTAAGTYVSLRYGVWSGGAYHPDRLTLINLPVLKAHGMAGATIAWKNLIGFGTTYDADRRYGGDGWTEMHDFYWGYTGTTDPSYGLLGRLMALVRAPDLNLVDAIWVADDNYWAINVIRQDVILASTDPFAVDWYASEHVLYPTVGYWQHVSAARAGTFRSATRVNQNAAAAVWMTGPYPWIDLFDSYDGDVPSDEERAQMNVFVAGGPLFADGFESGDTTTWSATVP